MLQEFILNPVVLAVLLLLVLSALRLNVVFALVISSLFGGLIAKMSGTATMEAFSTGLSRGAQLAFNYAMLGAFSIAISRSGVTELLAKQLFKKLNADLTPGKLLTFKYILLGSL